MSTARGGCVGRALSLAALLLLAPAVERAYRQARGEPDDE